MGVKFTSGLGAVKKLIEEQAHEKKEEVAKLLLGHVEQGLQGPRHGKTYKIPGTDRTYTASAPGEFPAFRTGQLLQSMKAKILDHAAVVGTNSNLAAMVSAERPFLDQLAEEAEPQIAAVIKSPWLGLNG